MCISISDGLWFEGQIYSIYHYYLLLFTYYHYHYQLSTITSHQTGQGYWMIVEVEEGHTLMTAHLI
jgi:hypothetical protein